MHPSLGRWKIHSINVMALALGFAYHQDLSLDETKILSLCALLHDFGKIRIAREILVASRRLTKKDFEKRQLTASKLPWPRSFRVISGSNYPYSFPYPVS
jgi:HD superfamily phosphohydrolase YqeK